MTLKVVFEPDEEGGYTVLVPALPEVATEGDSLDEAKQAADEAIVSALLARKSLGKPMPDEGPNFRREPHAPNAPLIMDLSPSIEALELA